jgi:hypothetical protein
MMRRGRTGNAASDVSRLTSTKDSLAPFVVVIASEDIGRIGDLALCGTVGQAALEKASTSALSTLHEEWCMKTETRTPSSVVQGRRRTGNA